MADIKKTATATFKADTKEYDKGVKGMDSANKKAEKSTDGLNSAVDSLNTGLAESVQSLGILPGKLNGAIGGVGKLTNGFKGLKFAIAATGIGALLLALTALAQYFTKSAEGQEKFLKITKTAGAILGKVTDVAIDLGKAIFGIFENPKAAFDAFIQTFKDFFESRFQLALKSVKLLSSAFDKLFSGDFAGAAQDLGEGFIDINRAINPLVISAELLYKGATAAGEAIAGFADEVTDAAQKAFDLAERRNKLDREEIAFIERKAFLEERVEALKLKAADTSLSELERLKAIQQATAFQNELSNTAVKIAKERAAILEGEQALGSNTIEDNRELAELKAQILAADKERATKLKELVTQENTLLTIVNKYRDSLKQAIEEPITDSAIDLSGIEVILPEGYKEFNSEEALAAETERVKANLAEQDAAAAESAQIQADYAAWVTERKKEQTAQQIDAAGQLFATAGTLLKEGSAAQKAVGIAEALINTYKGVNASLAYGGPVGIALAAVTAAAGLLSVQKIIATPLPEVKTTAPTAKFAQGGYIPANGGMIQGQDHSVGGVKFAMGGGVGEAQGGEFIVNRRATAAYRPMLEKINNTGRRNAGRSNTFANGGFVGLQERLRARREVTQAANTARAVLVVEDYTRVNDRVEVAESLATL